jgi:hypothetical protein
VDIQRAEEENAAISLGRPQRLMILDAETVGEDGSPEVANMDPLFKYDDHNIHYIVIRRFILSGPFRDLPTKAQAIAFAHADAHQTVLAQQAQAQMQAQAEATPGGGKPGPGGEAPPTGKKTPTGEPRELAEGEFAQGGVI